MLNKIKHIKLTNRNDWRKIMIIGIISILIGTGILFVNYTQFESMKYEAGINSYAVEDVQTIMLIIGLFFIVLGILAVVISQMKKNAKRMETTMSKMYEQNQEEISSGVKYKAYCVYCGQGILDGSQFCSKCGKNIESMKIE